MAGVEDDVERLVDQLKESGEELTGELEEMLEHSERIGESFDSLQNVRTSVAEAVNAEWSELGSEIETFLGSVRNEGSESTGAVQQAVQAVSTGAEAAQTLMEQAGASAESTREGLATTRESLVSSSDNLEQLVESVEAIHQGLTERVQTVEQELTRVLNEARDYLATEVKEELESLGTQVEESEQRILEAFSERHEQVLQTSVGDFESKVQEVESLVTTAFSDASQHALTAFESATTEYAQYQDQAIGERVEKARELAGKIEMLKGTVEGTKEEIATGLGDLGSSKQEAEDGLSAVEDALDNATGALEHFLRNYNPD